MKLLKKENGTIIGFPEEKFTISKKCDTANGWGGHMTCAMSGCFSLDNEYVAEEVASEIASLIPNAEMMEEAGILDISKYIKYLKSFPEFQSAKKQTEEHKYTEQKVYTYSEDMQAETLCLEEEDGYQVCTEPKMSEFLKNQIEKFQKMPYKTGSFGGRIRGLSVTENEYKYKFFQYFYSNCFSLRIWNTLNKTWVN